jgi:hypothetical protein
MDGIWVKSGVLRQQEMKSLLYLYYRNNRNLKKSSKRLYNAVNRHFIGWLSHIIINNDIIKVKKERKIEKIIL